MISASLQGTMLMPAMPKSPSTRNYQLTGGNDAGSKKNLAHGDTPDPCMAPLPPGGLQNSAGVAAFLVGPAVRANNSELRAVRHTELVHDLPRMSFDGTFPHPQLARNSLVCIASTQEFEDRPLPRC